MSLISMAGFKTSNVTVRRNDGGAGSWVNGKYVPTSNSTFDIVASIQPLTGKEIQLLPEGRQETKSIKIFTDVELFINDQIAKTQADVVLHDGVEYEIFTVNNWSLDTCIPHFECVGIMVDPQGDL